ncbi:MAG: N-formylglutamate amidohydrolase [Chloroflexota bacterium]
MNPLPIILSRPHGGLSIPVEIQDRLAIDETALYNDCDLWIDKLFDFDNPDLEPYVPKPFTKGVLATVSMPIARALIDANRPLSMLGKPDGPVKTQTSYGEPIYSQPLAEDLQEKLIDGYWKIYHQQLEDALEAHHGNVELVIDCHNMAQHGPSAYKDPGSPRPLICIGTLADKDGNPRPDRGWSFCSREAAFETVALAEKLFGDMDLLEPNPSGPTPVAALNQPYAGSYVIMQHLDPDKQKRNYVDRGVKPPATIMVEVNRGLFVGDQDAHTVIANPNEECISAIRQRLYQWAIGLLDIFNADKDL